MVDIPHSTYSQRADYRFHQMDSEIDNVILSIHADAKDESLVPPPYAPPPPYAVRQASSNDQDQYPSVPMVIDYLQHYSEVDDPRSAPGPSGMRSAGRMVVESDWVEEIDVDEEYSFWGTLWGILSWTRRTLSCYRSRSDSEGSGSDVGFQVVAAPPDLVESHQDGRFMQCYSPLNTGNSVVQTVTMQPLPVPQLPQPQVFMSPLPVAQQAMIKQGGQGERARK